MLSRFEKVIHSSAKELVEVSMSTRGAMHCCGVIEFMSIYTNDRKSTGKRNSWDCMVFHPATEITTDYRIQAFKWILATMVSRMKYERRVIGVFSDASEGENGWSANPDRGNNIGGINFNNFADWLGIKPVSTAQSQKTQNQLYLYSVTLDQLEAKLNFKKYQL